MKSLSELAEEYKENIDNLQAQLDEMKSKHRELTKSYNPKSPGNKSSTALTLEHDMAVVESMLAEQCEIYHKLKDYYKK